jgi:FkbM family methyltransferase
MRTSDGPSPPNESRQADTGAPDSMIVPPQPESLKAALDTASCRYGTMAFFRNDPVIGRSLREYGEWAQIEIDLLLNLIDAGSVVLDIGAYIGTHTLAFAAKAGRQGRVHGFEPIPDHFSVLQRNVKANGADTVTLHNAGLSCAAGEMSAQLQDPAGQTNFGATSLDRSPRRDGQQRIRTTTLDALELARCDFIKMDAEGMEADILRGGKAMLTALRPIVYAECNSLDNAWPCVLAMRELGYATSFFLFDAFNADNYRRSPHNFFGAAREAGLLFMPAGNAKTPAPGMRVQSAIVTIDSLDDLALCLLRKPQYKWEVLAHTTAAKTLGAGFFANEIELAKLQAKAQQQIARLNDQLEAARNGDEN